METVIWDKVGAVGVPHTDGAACLGAAGFSAGHLHHGKSLRSVTGGVSDRSRACSVEVTLGTAQITSLSHHSALAGVRAVFTRLVPSRLECKACRFRLLLEDRVQVQVSGVLAQDMFIAQWPHPVVRGSGFSPLQAIPA